MHVQDARITAFCHQNEWPLVKIVDDGGESAGTLDRPGLHELMEAVKRGEVDKVIATGLDRLTRSTRDALEFAEFLRKNYVELILLDGGECDLTTPDGVFSLTVRAAFAEYERNQIRQRTRNAMRQRRKDGFCLAHAPYGYEKGEGRPHRHGGGGVRLVPNPKEQQVIADVIAMRENGMTLWAIADEMNRRGIPTKKGLVNSWTASAIFKMLKNIREYGAVPQQQ